MILMEMLVLYQLKFDADHYFKAKNVLLALVCYFLKMRNGIRCILKIIEVM